MDIKDTLWLSVKDLSHNKVRTALTIMMVVIGIATIVALTSITAGVSQSISSSLNSLGPTSIIMIATSSTGFTSTDVASISTLPNITSVTPIITGSATVVAASQNISATILGISISGLSQLLNGNVITYEGIPFANNTITPSALIGYSIAFPSATSPQSVVVGDPATLKISSAGSASKNGGSSTKTLSVPVTGILNSQGSSLIPVDSAVIISLASAEILLHKNSYNELLIKANNVSSVAATSSQLSGIYGNSARVTNVASILSSVSSITGSITLLLAVIAGISLLVASIGIMNVMLMSVMERTREVGIMKAIGFKNKNVLTIFLIQAVAIGFLGGAIGIGLGVGVSYGLTGLLSHGSSSSAPASSSSPASATGSSGSLPARGGGSTFKTSSASSKSGFSSASSTSPTSSLSIHPVFQLSTILEALFVAVLVSALAGLYPSWKASRMEPIDAIRSL